MSGDKGQILVQSPLGAQGIGVDGYKWTGGTAGASGTSSGTGTAGGRPRAFLAQVKKPGTEKGREKDRFKTGRNNVEPEEEECTCTAARRVRQLTHDLEHVTVVHTKLLARLHVQIEDLKIKNRDLTFELLMSPFAAGVQQHLPFSPESDDNSIKSDNTASSASTLPKSLSSNSSEAFEVETTPEEPQRDSTGRSKVFTQLKNVQNVTAAENSIASEIQLAEKIASNVISKEETGSVLNHSDRSGKMTYASGASAHPTNNPHSVESSGQIGKKPLSEERTAEHRLIKFGESNPDLEHLHNEKRTIRKPSATLEIKESSTLHNTDKQQNNPMGVVQNRHVAEASEEERSRSIRFSTSDRKRDTYTPPPSEEDGPGAMLLWRAKRGRAGHGDPRQARSLDMELLEQEALQAAAKLKEEQKKTAYLSGLVEDLKRELKEKASLVEETHAPLPSTFAQRRHFAATAPAVLNATEQDLSKPRTFQHGVEAETVVRKNDTQRNRHRRETKNKKAFTPNQNASTVLPPIEDKVNSDGLWNQHRPKQPVVPLPSAVILPSISSRNVQNVGGARNDQLPSKSEMWASDFEKLLKKNTEKNPSLQNFAGLSRVGNDYSQQTFQSTDQRSIRDIIPGSAPSLSGSHETLPSTSRSRDRLANSPKRTSHYRRMPESSTDTGNSADSAVSKDTTGKSLGPAAVIKTLKSPARTSAGRNTKTASPVMARKNAPAYRTEGNNLPGLVSRQEITEIDIFKDFTSGGQSSNLINREEKVQFSGKDGGRSGSWLPRNSKSFAKKSDESSQQRSESGIVAKSSRSPSVTRRKENIYALSSSSTLSENRFDMTNNPGHRMQSIIVSGTSKGSDTVDIYRADESEAVVPNTEGSENDVFTLGGSKANDFDTDLGAGALPADDAAGSSVVTHVSNTNPLAGNTNPLAGNTNPLAGNTNPLASNTNPLAGNTNPLAGNTNPLAGNTNPLASNTNPLAGNTNPLAGNTNPLAGNTNPLAGNKSRAKNKNRNNKKGGRGKQRKDGNNF